jgi:hypothetical protein
VGNGHLTAIQRQFFITNTIIFTKNCLFSNYIVTYFPQRAATNMASDTNNQKTVRMETCGHYTELKTPFVPYFSQIQFDHFVNAVHLMYSSDGESQQSLRNRVQSLMGRLLPQDGTSDLTSSQHRELVQILERFK